MNPHSWEMPPGAIFACAPLRVHQRSDGRVREWELQLQKLPASASPILWFRALDSDPQDGGFVAFDASWHQQRPFFADEEPSVLRLAFADILKRGHFARGFFFNERGELRGKGQSAHESLLIAPDGVGAWSLGMVSTDIHDAALFTWGCSLMAEEFAGLSAHFLWERVGQQLQDLNSEAAFARRFALWSEDERHRQTTRWARGDAGKLRACLRDLLGHSSVWQHESQPGALSLIVYSAAKMRLETDEWGDPFADEDELEVPGELRAGVERIWRYFDPRDRPLDRYRCARSWKKHNPLHFAVSMNRPSAHEQLEARLRWRQWQQNTP